MKVITAESTGKIICSSGVDADFDTTLLDSRHYVIEDARTDREIVDTFYIEDGVLTQYPPKPSDLHIFDYTAREWCECENYQQIVQDRLTARRYLETEESLASFARERDIDIQEIQILLTSGNALWQAEAAHFQTMYAASWEAFYANTTPPVLSWDGIA
jgi:hypothetical protein